MIPIPALPPLSYYPFFYTLPSAPGIGWEGGKRENRVAKRPRLVRQTLVGRGADQKPDLVDAKTKVNTPRHPSGGGKQGGDPLRY